MVSDTETKSPTVIGEKVDLINGVMGVPSDKFLEASGPQSLYAYDYSRNHNMNVSYSEFSNDPLSSLTVKQFPFSSNDKEGNRVVIQVEVRLM